VHVSFLSLANGLMFSIVASHSCTANKNQQVYATLFYILSFRNKKINALPIKWIDVFEFCFTMLTILTLSTRVRRNDAQQSCYAGHQNPTPAFYFPSALLVM
jgi:hypothetical protein